MSKELTVSSSDCVNGEKSKGIGQTRSTMTKIETLKCRVENICLVIAELLRSSCNERYFLTIIDRYIRCTKIRDIAAATMDRMLFTYYVSRFGSPLRFSSEKGAQTTS